MLFFFFYYFEIVFLCIDVCMHGCLHNLFFSAFLSHEICCSLALQLPPAPLFFFLDANIFIFVYVLIQGREIPIVHRVIKVNSFC